MNRIPGVELRVDGGYVGTRDGETSVPVVVKGSNVADDSPVTALSFVVDENGDAALRVVDAAPFAYDDVNDRLRVTSEPVEELVNYREISAASVGAGTGTEWTTIDPGAGFLGVVIRAWAYAPAIAGSTGNHSFQAVIDPTSVGAYANERPVNVEATGVTALNLSMRAADQTYLAGLVFSSANPLRWRYSNGTNVAQAGTRAFGLYYTRRKVQAA